MLMMMQLSKMAVAPLRGMLASTTYLRLVACSPALQKKAFRPDIEIESEWWVAGAAWDERDMAMKQVRESDSGDAHRGLGNDRVCHHT
jgi:hypothetical protein